MYHFRFLFFMLFFCFALNVHSQKEITHQNYVSIFKEAQQDSNDGNFSSASEKHYALIDFLNSNKETVKDTLNNWLTKNYYSLCRLYLFQEEDLSLKYADSTIAAALRSKDNNLIFRGYSIKYYCLYDVKGKEKDLDFLADKCIEYATIMENDKHLAESFMHKCNSLVELKKNEEAEIYCNKAVDLFKTIGDESYLSSVYNNIGNVFSKSNLNEKALGYYNKSHELSIKTKDARNISLSALNIAEKNELLGNYKIAAKYYRVYGDSTEAHYKRLVDTKFTEAEAKYQTEQKDKEIAEQQLEIAQQKNNRNNWIIGSILFIAIALGAFQGLINKQKRKKLLAESNFKNEQEINELRTKFLGNIAHEIRTPLTLISGNLDLALENYDDKDKAIQNIKTALSNSKKVVEDANEILELLKFEKNKTTIKLSPVNLNETLKRIFYAFNSLADIKHIDLNYESNIPESFSTKLDVEKVEKILNNLISNAIKYSPANSKIIFNAEVHEEQLTVKITDFGQGIHFNETEKIFQRFYQSSQSNAVGGIGIGLSLAKEFAELLNGSLNVESELTKGSTFIFTLPVESIEEVESNLTNVSKTEVITEEYLEEIMISSTKKPKILIVEDNPEMCNYMVEILSQSYDCSTAFDGEEALTKIKKNTYDLITSDIMMPKMDGFQLREKLNENKDYKYIPFILISAKTLEEDKIKGFNLGINDYIVKPFNKTELIARIKNLLINKKSREKWILQQDDLLIDSESSDVKLLKKIENTAIDNLSDENFKISDLAKNVGYSQRQLTRILKQYTGMSPVKFILEIRLQKAYQLLQNKTFYTLSEVRYDVGITSSSYFNKKFKERFGLNPSELLS